MNGFNKIILAGNLTKDPEIRYLSSGAGVCKFGIAVNQKRKDEDNTLFVNCVAWEKLGEICNQYLKKGKPVLVEGRLEVRQYDDKEGVKRTSVEVVLTNMVMLPDGKGNDGEGGGGRSFSGGKRQAQAQEDDIDDEIPF